MKNTTTINLNKPEYSDVADIEVLNANMDIIDEQFLKTLENFKSLEEKIAQSQEESNVDLSNITDEINNINDEISKTNTNIATINTNLSNEINDLSESVTTDINAVNTNLLTNISSVNTSLSKDIIDLDSSLTTKINSLNTTLSKDITDLNTSLSKDITDLNTSLSTTINSTNADFTSEISSITTSIDDINSRIDYIYDFTRKLEDFTWQEISDISKAGTAGNYFCVGDKKSVALKGNVSTISIDETLYVYILGIDHNVALEGVGITFGTFKTSSPDGADDLTTDICIVDGQGVVSSGTLAFTMNHSTNSTLGGWLDCDLRYDILGSANSKGLQHATILAVYSPVSNSLLSCFPYELRIKMRAITKYSNNTGGKSGSYTISETTDYLPLMSECEIFGVTSHQTLYAKENEYQEQYAYFKSGNSKIKYEHTDHSTESIYLTRTPIGYTSHSGTCWLTISASGTYNTSVNSYSSVGLAPIFKV